MVAGLAVDLPGVCHGRQLPSRHSSMSKFDADGRRRIHGLSQAIRKHAYQSTSPTSEFKYGRQTCRSHETLSVGQRGRITVKTPPTIEERLRSLLNSDAEGTESQSSTSTSKNTFDRQPTFELVSRGCHGSYSPRLAESKMRAERLNRITTDKPSDAPTAVQNLKQRTRSLSSERPLTHDAARSEECSPSTVTAPCVRRNQTDALSDRLRRCVSAVPASFYDENWNVVSESPKRDEISNSPHFMFSTRNTGTAGTLPGRQTPTGAYNQAIWEQRPPPSPKRDAPANGQRSEIRTPGGSQARRTLEYTPSSLPMSAAIKYREGVSLQTAKPFHSRKNAQAPSSPAKKLNIPDEQGPSPSPRPMTVAQGVEKEPRPIQYSEAPFVAYKRKVVAANSILSVESNLKVSSVSSMSSHNSNPIPAKQTTSGPKIASQLVAGKLLRSPDSGRTKVEAPDDEPESCKSEDRDSGAILDAEASVFDFDSSAISDSEGETSQKTQKPTKSSQNKNTQSQREIVWSRSSTPTLPPLSPYDTDEETPRNSEQPDSSKVTTNSTNEPLSPVRNEVARLPSYESLLRKKRAQVVNGKIYGSAEGQDHNELSPTESAMTERSGRQKIFNSTKNSGVKVVAKTAEQKNQHHRLTKTCSRASFSDGERRVISHSRHRVGKKGNRHTKGQKRNQKNSEEYTYYDIDNSSSSKQKLGRYPVFYRPGEDGVGTASRDAEETSSVKSFTSASVASSFLRRNGRRHHRRNHGHAYAKEVRAVNKRFSRLEAHVVTLARSVAQLSSEMRQQNDTARDIEELRAQLEELRRDKVARDPPSRKSSSSSRTKSDSSRTALHSKTHPKRVVKLTKFFGEKPPILSLFLAQMGYEKYIDNFNSESITMVELPYMDEERLKSIGIPLGPRLRILNEAKKTCFV